MYFKQLIYLLVIINLYDGVLGGYLMPDESHQHTATWMAYGATTWTWGRTTPFYSVSRLVARKDLMRLAANIARFENVKMLINDGDQDEANQFLTQIQNEAVTSSHSLPPSGTTYTIQFITQPVDDLWARDTAPVFVYNNKAVLGVNFNFNGWGQENTGAAGWTKDPNKVINGVIYQSISNDQKVADFIIQNTKITTITTWLVMEGGGVEVNGKGTAICTESCILNNNRNPGRSKSDVEAELLRVLGIQKVIWLPGLKGYDVTDGHIDFYARFVGDSTVVCYMDTDPTSLEYATTQQNFKILSTATDALGNKLTVVSLIKPNVALVQAAVVANNGWANVKNSYNPNAFAMSYVGFYLGNNFLIMPKFGDTVADTLAFITLKTLYPTRTVMQISTDGIANGGGSIHCATQQQILTLQSDATLNSVSLFIALLALASTCFYQFIFV